MKVEVFGKTSAPLPINYTFHKLLQMLPYGWSLFAIHQGLSITAIYSAVLPVKVIKMERTDLPQTQLFEQLV